MNASRAKDLATASVHLLWDEARKRWHCYAVVRGAVVWSQPIDTTTHIDGPVARALVKAIEQELLAHLPF